MKADDNIFVNGLKETVSLLPELPGIYQYFSSEGKIIYVGKAKNLRKRVSSYFIKQHSDRKTSVLVNKIAEIRHIVVESEEDALLLENNFIKRFQPRYNVLLKDDKSFPWICVKNERFPRVFYTRNVIRDGSTYFGPYTSIPMVRTILDVIKRLYPLRNCNFNLSNANIERKKFKVCLEYYIGNCKGPCEGLQMEEEYNENIRQIIMNRHYRLIIIFTIFPLPIVLKLLQNSLIKKIPRPDSKLILSLSIGEGIRLASKPSPWSSTSTQICFLLMLIVIIISKSLLYLLPCLIAFVTLSIKTVRKAKLILSFKWSLCSISGTRLRHPFNPSCVEEMTNLL